MSVIIPVYNELGTVEEVIERVERIGCSKEILIVDDGSIDGTGEVVQRRTDHLGVRAFFHTENRGKGAAIRTALPHATGEIIVIQDADLEYDPDDIDLLLRPILEGRADVVFGSRFAKGSQTSSGRLHRAANGFLTWLSNRCTGLSLSDMETCYKAMRRNVAIGLTLRENRFGIEPELTARIARSKWRVAEVPIRYKARTHAAGKKIGFIDGLRAVWCVMRYSLWD